MKVALYVRVSTQRQDQAQTSAQQLERLRAHLQAEGYKPSDEEIFDDEGYSGALLAGPRWIACATPFSKVALTAC